MVRQLSGGAHVQQGSAKMVRWLVFRLLRAAVMSLGLVHSRRLFKTAAGRFMMGILLYGQGRWLEVLRRVIT